MWIVTRINNEHCEVLCGSLDESKARKRCYELAVESYEARRAAAYQRWKDNQGRLYPFEFPEFNQGREGYDVVQVPVL